MAERKHGNPAPPTRSTVVSRDWDGRDLTDERHDNVAFVDVDMTDAHDTGSVFSECAFRGVRFNASVHTNAAFLNCTFVRCSLFDASFTGCKFLGSMFDDCSYDIRRASGGDWSFVGLPGANLGRTEFDDVRMREADLTGARCVGATLRRVDLSGAWLHSADLSGADLRGSDLSAVEPLDTVLRGAVIDTYQAVVIAQGLGLEGRAD